MAGTEPTAAKWHEHACDRYVAEHQALQDLGRAVRVLLGLGWSMRRVITWARAVEPRPTSSADLVDIRDLPAFGTQFRFAWRTLREWWVSRG